MRIAQIAPLNVPVPPPHYGGTERVISNLTEALVSLGHDVTLFACGESRTTGRLSAFVPQALADQPDTDGLAWHMAMMTEVYRRASEFDVIHSHMGYGVLPFAAASRTPTVHTLHGRLNLQGKQVMMRMYRDANYVSISNNQRLPVPDLNWLATIYHGVDVDAFPYRTTPGDYLAFVGRISPEKGPDTAIRIAKRTGIPLKIAAKVDPVDQEYFDSVIKPQLDTSLIEFLGPVPEQPKRDLLANALALLLPINWPEPFGMVFIESLACGTPVLTRPLGSTIEVLADGVTGFMAMTEDALTAATLRVQDISRPECRAYAKRRFDIHRMAMEYVNAYSQVREEPQPFKLDAQLAVG